MLTVSSEFSVPDCYRFSPTKEEILCYFLRPAIKGEPLSSNILSVGEIYGENREPWNLFDKAAPTSFWVFTKLKKKSKSRIDRTAGCGCWLGRSIKEIKNARGRVLGFDKYFTFTCKNDKSSSKANGNWIMHEFSLIDEVFSEYVICEIRNKDVAMSSIHQEGVGEEAKNKKRKYQQTMIETSSFPGLADQDRPHDQEAYVDVDGVMNGLDLDKVISLKYDVQSSSSTLH